MKKLLPLIMIPFVLVSCKMNYLYLNVIEPAPVTLSQNIKKVGVINRSVPTDETKILDVIDKALSLEGVNLDKDGAEEAIKGLSDLNIKKVGVINRSVPTDETKILDVIDKALSLEGVNLDKDGAEEAIKGL